MILLGLTPGPLTFGVFALCSHHNIFVKNRSFYLILIFCLNYLAIQPIRLTNTMKPITLSDQEKRDLLKKLTNENSVKLADKTLKYVDALNKKYAKYEFTTEFYSNLNLYISDIISRNFSKFNESDSYTNALVNYNLTSTDIENYLGRLKADAVIRIINKVYFEKKDFI
jgi:hypothetical protein